MENNTLTVEQVLRICIEQLNAIQIMVGQMETIGEPIKSVAHNLTVCVEALNEKKEEDGAEDGRETDSE